MAKNFGKAGSNKSFGEVAAKAEQIASVEFLKNISNDDLVDNPKNGEDVLFTADLEQSMREMGFTDPLEVTDYGMEDGKYMILSGHRRRAAGVKVGMKSFPALIRHFQSADEVQNYTLLSNSQRDSAKDPFLFTKRYRMHEQYLKESGYTGNIREAVAERLGLSVQQADRYNAMNRVIMPVWDMVRAEQVAMSAVAPLAAHTEEEQKEIVRIMEEAQKKGVTLTRDTVKKIVDGYREGKKTWAEIDDLPRDSGLPLNPFIDPEPGQTPDNDEGGTSRNDEVNREFDPIAAEADAMDSDKADWEAQQSEGDGEPLDVGENEEKDPKSMTDDERRQKRGADIQKALSKLENLLNEAYEIEGDEVEEYIGHVGSLVSVLVDDVFNTAEQYGLVDSYRADFKAARQSLNSYLKRNKGKADDEAE